MWSRGKNSKFNKIEIRIILSLVEFGRNDDSGFNVSPAFRRPLQKNTAAIYSKINKFIIFTKDMNRSYLIYTSIAHFLVFTPNILFTKKIQQEKILLEHCCCYADVSVSVCIIVVCIGAQVIWCHPCDWVGLLVGVRLSFQISSVVTTHSRDQQLIYFPNSCCVRARSNACIVLMNLFPLSRPSDVPLNVLPKLSLSGQRNWHCNRRMAISIPHQLFLFLTWCPFLFLWPLIDFSLIVV